MIQRAQSRSTTPSILDKTEIAIIDGDTMSMNIFSQILTGLGARNFHKCFNLTDAGQLTERTELDLLIMDPASAGEGGYDFIPRLRRAARSPNRFVQTIIATGHTPQSRVRMARDTGANFVILKPIAPSVLLSRIMWLANEKRGFIESKRYVGPDRRFKFEGLPSGTTGRRSTDLEATLGEATEPNLSQLDIDALMKPRKVIL